MMRRLGTPLGLIATLALGACAVGPNYRLPATPGAAAGGFISAPAEATSSEPTEANWWRLYQDPVLNRLVEQALVENRDLQVAAANLNYAQALVSQARSSLLPSTDVSAGATYGRNATANSDAEAAGRSYAPSAWVYSTGFTAAYQVDLFGQVRRSIESAKANAGAALAAQDAVRVTVAAETTAAYVQACGYAGQAVLARRALAAQQGIYDMALRQHALGAASDIDLARAAAALAQAKAVVPVLDGQHRVALLTLTALLGRTPSEIPADAAACAAPPRLARPIPVGDGAALLRRRPDVRQAERTLAADTAKIGVAVAQLYPSVTLGGAISDAALSVNQLSAPGSISSGVGPLISWTFPNVLQARANIREAKAAASAALAGFDSTFLQALKETEQTLTTYGADLDRRGQVGAVADRTAETLRLSQIQYDRGAISWPDLLAAQIASADADQALAAADQQLASDQVALFQALGGGWEQAPVVKPPKVAG